MEIVTLVRYGPPVILLGLIISNVRLNVVVNSLVESVKDMRDGVVWTARYDDHVDEVDRRLDRLEAAANGKK